MWGHHLCLPDTIIFPVQRFLELSVTIQLCQSRVRGHPFIQFSTVICSVVLTLHQLIYLVQYRTVVQHLGHVDLHFMLNQLWLQFVLRSLFLSLVEFLRNSIRPSVRSNSSETSYWISFKFIGLLVIIWTRSYHTSIFIGVMGL